METFLVRLFVAADLEGFEGTVQRPGHAAVGFHDEAELIRRLLEVAGRLEPGPGRVGDGEAHAIEQPAIAERLP